MIRFMLDTDVLTDLTDHAGLLATYSDLVTDPAAFERQFPHSKVLWIDRGLGDPNDKATIMDIETGALTVQDVPAKYDLWASQLRQYITVYVNRDNMPEVNLVLGSRTAWHWVATLDGTAHIPGIRSLWRPAAIQCLTATDLGVHADGSLVFEDAWHPAPTQGVIVAVKRDLNTAISASAALTSDLHKMAVTLGG